MMELRPRHFVNRGSILASGFMIRWDIAGVNAARRRVLDLWHPGLQLKKTDSAFIVLLPSPMRVIAEGAVGEPLVRYGALLLALPLGQKDAGSLNLTSDSIVYAKNGRIQITPLTALPEEDMAQWIDTDSAEIVNVTSLGAPPEPPSFQAPAFNARKMVEAPASPELQQLLTELRQPQPREGATGIWQRVNLPRIDLLGAFRKLFQNLRRLSFRPFRRKSGAQTVARTAEHRAPTTSKPGSTWLWLQRGRDWLLNFTRFSRILNLRHARYFSRMVELMQSGDLEEGLRHAIPLADVPGFAGQKRSSFGMPQRRSSLSIQPFRDPPQSTWALDGSSYVYLRNLYRQAFERLAAQGRVEEAAFVLTELLASHAEAVSFLEKHGRLRLAAEIAEAKNLSPAMTVRLWWLAREYKHAIRLACRTGEFEAAIKHLRGSHPEEANQLLVFWAERLAASGKYLAAAEAIWPMKEGQRLANRWYSQAIALGGSAGSIALARRAARFPESFPDVVVQVESLLADETNDAARVRLAFVESLRQERRSPGAQALARAATRSIVRDLQQGRIEFTPAQLDGLLHYAGDVSLRVDVPPVRALHGQAKRDSPLALPEIAANDVGLHRVTDLALLPNGQLLLALGEAGILFLSRDGKPVAQLNQPAHKLVVSDEGSRVIGIAPRDSASRLVRIDVLARTASYWCDTTISAYAGNFDGSVWCVAEGEDVFQIDTLAPGFEALWRIPDLAGNVRAMRRNSKERILYVVTGNLKQLTLWTFDQPSCRLRARQEFAKNVIPETVVGQSAIAISEAGDIYEQVAVLLPGQKNWQTQIYQTETHPAGGRLVLDSGTMLGGLRPATSYGSWMAIPVWKESDIEVFLVDSRSGKCKLCLRLRGAKEISLRFAESILLCADNQGRVLAFDVLTNQTMRDLRV